MAKLEQNPATDESANGMATTISGLVEVELSAGNGESDISLATVEIGLDADLAPWARANVLLLWEEGEGPVEVDEGYLTIGNPDQCPFSLLGGKMVVPFGIYDSYMLQDSLTLQMGETGDTAIVLGFRHDSGLNSSVYGFNGDWLETGEDETINSFGAGIGYSRGTDSLSYSLRADWLNNLAESDVVSDTLTGVLPANELTELVAGMAISFSMNVGPVGILADYVTALDSFAATELAFGGQGAEPATWGVEIGFDTEMSGLDTTFAVGLQGSDEALDLGLPESRMLASASTALREGINLTLEYLLDDDYSIADGGTDEDSSMATLQLAMEF